jgi:hypothetical protein
MSAQSFASGRKPLPRGVPSGPGSESASEPDVQGSVLTIAELGITEPFEPVPRPQSAEASHKSPQITPRNLPMVSLKITPESEPTLVRFARPGAIPEFSKVSSWVPRKGLRCQSGVPKVSAEFAKVSVHSRAMMRRIAVPLAACLASAMFWHQPQGTPARRVLKVDNRHGFHEVDRAIWRGM